MILNLFFAEYQGGEATGWYGLPAALPVKMWCLLINIGAVTCSLVLQIKSNH